MATVVISCCPCHSDRLVGDGSTPDGRQRHQGRPGGRRSAPAARPNGYSPDAQATLLRACHERASLRGGALHFGVSRTTLSPGIENKPPGRPRTTPCRCSNGTRGVELGASDVA